MLALHSWLTYRVYLRSTQTFGRWPRTSGKPSVHSLAMPRRFYRLAAATVHTEKREGSWKKKCSEKQLRTTHPPGRGHPSRRHNGQRVKNRAAMRLWPVARSGFSYSRSQLLALFKGRSKVNIDASSCFSMNACGI